MWQIHSIFHTFWLAFPAALFRSVKLIKQSQMVLLQQLSSTRFSEQQQQPQKKIIQLYIFITLIYIEEGPEISIHTFISGEL